MDKIPSSDPIRTHYPKALPASALTAGWIDLLATRAGIGPEGILLADSICSDDVNGIQYPAPLRELYGPFRLGGLDGIPFTGITGMGAYAHHVPLQGAALIWYGPHIGISQDGTVGGIVRVGREHEGPGGCCGAMLAGVSHATDPKPAGPGKKHYDHQMDEIKRILLESGLPSGDRTAQLKHATEAIYRHSDEQITSFVEDTGFQVRYVMIAGTILINTDPEQEMHLELRTWKLYDTQSKSWENLMQPGA